MNGYTFSLPQEIIVGAGSRERLAEMAKKLGGGHAFIISGPHLAKMGLVEQCAQMLAREEIQADVFAETEGNPSVETVERAKDAYMASGADFIIAFGGGSPMDVAKAVAVTAKYGGCITEYEGSDKVPGKIVPLIAIPTTAGTGSEVTAFSVITDHSRNYKLTVSGRELIPDVAILDPELITTAPCSVAAACGMDALVHAVEAYLSRAASPFTDAMAEKAMESIGSSIKRYVANREDRDAAEKMMTGSLFAGIAFSQARLGNVHAMSHPVSAYFDVPHGVANAILFPTVVEYNALADQGKYYKIYSYLADKKQSPKKFIPSMLAEQITELNRELGIPDCLRKVGVTEDKISDMAADAMRSGNIGVNPRSTEKRDIIELYRKAF